ncbi:MAG: NAD(+) diphosphatase [Rhodospirillales bacterium]|nr:NAD(+) diphosphatase [Rhodospirillales bacterium]
MDSTIAYAGCTIDRATQFRVDADWLQRSMSDPAVRVLPVWRDRNLVAGGTRPRLLALGEGAAVEALSLAHEAAFLGRGADGVAWFACDLSHHAQDRLAPIAAGASFEDLGRVVTVLDRNEGGLLAYARAIAYWHRRHRFCGVCGAATASRQGGHMRECLNEACAAQHFPRTDPVVIMLVTCGDACLLARQKRWIAGLMSALAGFVEPGETAEDAVRREVLEEVGLKVCAVRYRTSQPWPFPSSLMLGFRAEVAGEGIIDAPLVLDEAELEDARWFRRDEVAAMRAHGLRLPFRGTIARALVEEWLAGDVAGSR